MTPKTANTGKADILNIGSQDRCCQCGMCESVCKVIPLQLTDGKNNQDYFPVSVNENACLVCKSKRCIEVCPVVGEEAELNEWLGPSVHTLENDDFGQVKKVVISTSKDRQIAKSGSSGGVVTSLLKYLLETRQIDGAIVVTTTSDSPGGEFVIVTDPDELISSCSSKYDPVHFGRVFNQVAKQYRHKKLAIVARPCQLRALEKAEKVSPHLKRVITLKISIFCAWLISRKGVEFLGSLSGVDTDKNLKSIDFRKGTWPGNIEFETDEGTHELPMGKSGHTNGTYYYPAVAPFIPADCRTCFDVTGKLADISCGDPWNLNLGPKDGAGYTMSILRSDRALDIFDSNQFREYVETHQTLSFKQLDQSQGNTIRVKKAGVYLEKYQCLSEERAIKWYNFANKIYSAIVRTLPRWAIPNGLINFYSKRIWAILQRKLDADLFIEEN